MLYTTYGYLWVARNSGVIWVPFFLVKLVFSIMRNSRFLYDKPMSHWRLEFTDVKISQEAMFHK